MALPPTSAGSSLIKGRMAGLPQCDGADQNAPLGARSRSGAPRHSGHAGRRRTLCGRPECLARPAGAVQGGAPANEIVLDFDAALVTAHSEKEGAAGTFKGGATVGAHVWRHVGACGLRRCMRRHLDEGCV